MDIEAELEQIKIKNVVLEKENEILMGNISMIAKEKKEMLEIIEQKDKLIKELKETIENLTK